MYVEGEYVELSDGRIGLITLERLDEHTTRYDIELGDGELTTVHEIDVIQTVELPKS
ncbi:hypothetical protein ACFOZY_09950 [Chungangia koreensis]|uniref:DUF4926 domain-containing protein n=1 Tax=Chungangia koreensis TaxID=752657 RepID=A0ABV8X5D2_9LACT